MLLPRLSFDSIDQFVEHHSQLLRLEYEEQKRAEQACLSLVSPKVLQQRGLALLNLKLTGQRSGLGGKTLLELEPLIAKEFVAHQLRTGDSVQFAPHGSHGGSLDGGDKQVAVPGVIYKLNEFKLVVALDQDPLFLGGGGEESAVSFRIVKTADDVTFKRLRRALEKLASGAAASWMEALIRSDSACQLSLTHIASLAFPYEPNLFADAHYYNAHLNPSQKSAVVGAINAERLFLVHGPPGTGKTATLVEIVRQLVCPKMAPFQPYARPLRLLVCGPSNLSVDNLVERLTCTVCSLPPLRLVRLGHPARLIDAVLPWTLDSQYRNSNQGLVSAELRAEMDAVLKSLSQPPSKRAGGLSRKQLYAELKALRSDLKAREKSGLASFLREFPIVAATCVGAGSNSLYHSLQHHAPSRFDVAIIDEAAQALEVECWLPMLLAQKVILAGDHCQLSPTVTSKAAEQQGLSVTLFDRLIRSQPSKHAYSALLTTQYRMHSLISEWSSAEMYRGQLKPDALVATHLLSDLPGVQTCELTRHPLWLIDTAGSYDCGESVGSSSSDPTAGHLASSESKSNPGEVALIQVHLRALRAARVQDEWMAVISPYSAQVGLLRNVLRAEFPALEIDTVDGFQGREKEAILISLVRSNASGDIGFLLDVRRMNVAITRAKRHVCLVADSSTLASHPFYERLLEYFMEHGQTLCHDGLASELEKLSVSER